MADVIFAGSPARPALGMAEVKMVIDNTSGIIPVPMTEIEVSRTIFRNGDSEYRIGGQIVRLLDVQELLSETGMSFTGRVLELRLQKARAMLADPQHDHLRVSDIAYASGFNDISYFNRTFRRRFGASPLQYRGGHIG